MPPTSKRPTRQSRSNSLQDTQKGAPNNGAQASQKGHSPSPFRVVEQPPFPKHFPFPNIPVDNDLWFEFQMTVFAFTSCCLQFLHLYRSVWWLPNSHSNCTMNFHLINVYLLVFIFIVLSRRLVYAGGAYLSQLLEGPIITVIDNDYTIFSYIVFVFFGCQLITCAVFVIDNQPRLNMLYLFYPNVLYIILFGYRIKPLFDCFGWCSEGKPPIHACSTNPEYIRNEAENLRVNFSARFNQIIFTAVVNAYYAGYLPCCFAQPQLQYDVFWAAQHTFFIFCGTFVFSASHMLHLRYCDTLHRCVLHLGGWNQVDQGRNMLSVKYDWREDQIWPSNSVVKYRQHFWKSIGECTSNRPGAKKLNTFYKVFITPAHLLQAVALVNIMVVFYQLFLLVKVSDWYKIISLALMIFFNYFTLYRVARDFLVSHQIYKDEIEIHVDEKLDIR